MIADADMIIGGRTLRRKMAPLAPVGEYAFRLTFVEPGTGRAVTTESAIVLAK